MSIQFDPLSPGTMGLLLAAFIIMVLSARSPARFGRALPAIATLLITAVFVSVFSGRAPKRTESAATRLEQVGERAGEAIVRVEKRLAEQEEHIKARVSRRLPATIAGRALEDGAGADEAEVVGSPASAPWPTTASTASVEATRFRPPDKPIPLSGGHPRGVSGPAAAVATVGLLVATGVVLKAAARRHATRHARAR